MAGRLQGKTAFCTASGAGIGRADGHDPFRAMLPI